MCTFGVLGLSGETVAAPKPASIAAFGVEFHGHAGGLVLALRVAE